MTNAYIIKIILLYNMKKNGIVEMSPIKITTAFHGYRHLIKPPYVYTGIHYIISTRNIHTHARTQTHIGVSMQLNS